MKNKKKLVTALAGLALIGLVGGTFAYFNSSATFENLFHTASVGVKYTENFVSPDNWQPGDTTPKTLTAKNESTVPVRVRAKVNNEEWQKGNTTLPLDQDGTIVAIKNFNTDDWKLEADDYYYYQIELPPNAETSTFINSVTYNPETDLSESCSSEGTIGEGEFSITCTAGEYAGATYTLELQIETIQANVAEDNEWYPITGVVFNTEGVPLEKQVCFIKPFSSEGEQTYITIKPGMTWQELYEIVGQNSEKSLNIKSVMWGGYNFISKQYITSKDLSVYDSLKQAYFEKYLEDNNMTLATYNNLTTAQKNAIKETVDNLFEENVVGPLTKHDDTKFEQIRPASEGCYLGGVL